MESTVKSLLASGKGILAADESFPTIEKRFEALNILSTEENRGTYREMLFTTPGLSEFISGVILFDETIRQRRSDGIPITIPEVLARQGIIPGIKVDKGTASLANFPEEKITQGLDGLRDRLREYRELGARFTKWRAVIAIGEQLPTRNCIEANSNALALFSALSQEAGLVPIVEPEILMNGSHTIDRCEEVTTATLESVFAALFEYRVVLEQMLLKTGMILPGAECPQQADVAEVAEATLRCFRRTVSAAVPGIMLLSGGQADEVATLRLDAICRSGDVPWRLSFSFGRALQSPALKIWKGSPTNVEAARAALHHRAKCNGLAIQGKYSVEMENTKSTVAE
ncbi:MAG TPA: class I fructose-bisphosphate aldolase [Candidatus Angelobacter sp.]|nr:class I fructose-bisphosphate aldolase [Candidatus Angelobacter sp.]